MGNPAGVRRDFEKLEQRRLEAAELLRDLETEYPGGVYIHPLGEMDLLDGTERRRLVSFLRAAPYASPSRPLILRS